MHLFKKTIIIIPLLLILVFIVEYFMMINYLKTHHFSQEVIKDEISYFNFKVIEKSIILTMYFIYITLSINIGFVYLKYKVKFINVLKIVLFGFLSLVITQIFSMINIWFSNYVFSTATVEQIEKSYYITHYLNTNNFEKYLLMPLDMTFNFNQILLILLLAFAMSTTVKQSYFKSLLITFKTYGISAFIMFLFLLMMEINFN